MRNSPYLDLPLRTLEEVRGVKVRNKFEALKSELRMDDLTGDAWGTAMGWRFALCDWLHFRTDEDVPWEWEYRPGAANDIQEDDSWKHDAFMAEDVETLIDFGHLLARYTDKLRLAGRDY